MTAIYPVLGQVSPTATSETDLYVVPGGKYAIGSSLILANITHLVSEANIFVMVRVRPAGVTSVNKHIVVPGIKVRPRTSSVVTIGITLAATDLVTVQCSVADGLAATLFGTVLP